VRYRNTLTYLQYKDSNKQYLLTSGDMYSIVPRICPWTFLCTTSLGTYSARPKSPIFSSPREPIRRFSPAAKRANLTLVKNYYKTANCYSNGSDSQYRHRCTDLSIMAPMCSTIWYTVSWAQVTLPPNGISIRSAIFAGLTVVIHDQQNRLTTSRRLKQQVHLALHGPKIMHSHTTIA